MNGQDANAIKRHGLGIEPNPMFVAACNCDVSGNGAATARTPTRCRARRSPSARTRFSPTRCESRTGARRVEISTDGASDVTLTGLLPGTALPLDDTPLGAVGPAGAFTAPVPAGTHTVLPLP